MINQDICIKIHAKKVFVTVVFAAVIGLSHPFCPIPIELNNVLAIEKINRNPNAKLAKFFIIFHKFHSATSRFKKDQ
jgi:hypothetical protein